MDKYWSVLNCLGVSLSDMGQTEFVCIELVMFAEKQEYFCILGWLGASETERVSREFLNTIRSALLQSTEHFSTLSWAHSLALVIKPMISMLAAPNERRIAVSHDWCKCKHALHLFSWQLSDGFELFCLWAMVWWWNMVNMKFKMTNMNYKTDCPMLHNCL